MYGKICIYLLQMQSKKSAIIAQFVFPRNSIEMSGFGGLSPKRIVERRVSQFIHDKCLVEYVWIGGKNELRSKTKVMDGPIDEVLQLPDWNFDGSSTAQACGTDSEVMIRPRALFK